MSSSGAITLRRAAGDLKAVPRTGMIAAAKAVKKLAADEASRVAGGTMAIHRKGKPPRVVKLRARDDIRAVGDHVVRCRVQALPVGPWVWLDSGTGPHLVGLHPRQRSRRRRGYAGPVRPGTGARLHVGRDWVTGPVGHPGARGKGAWRRVVTRAQTVVPQIFDDAVGEVVP